jgi:hypothetical protein
MVHAPGFTSTIVPAASASHTPSNACSITVR